MLASSPARLLRASGNFVAIDFETADRTPDSACAIGMVRVEKWRIVERAVTLIRPPRNNFIFSYLHGITWEHVRERDEFASVWQQHLPLLDGAEFLAAHNAVFDESVLQACCARAGLTVPRLRFECTMELARQVWSIYPTKLSDVCRRLKLRLNHHKAGSDAEACARIVIAARQALRKQGASARV